MKRAIILLMDSFGIGASLDAIKYGDSAADTFGHIFLNRLSTQQRKIEIPTLINLGLAHAHLASSGKRLPEIDYSITPAGIFGYAVETSFGKDTPSGHWELAGVPVHFDWGYFPPEFPSFPKKLTDELIKRGKLPGILGNRHASGTEIIDELGEEHIHSGKPIVYTSGDSVFQIAAHEHYFGLQQLYELSVIARELVDEYKIGRVIARPFIGEKGNFQRTANRRDLSIPPPDKTLLDKLIAANGKVIAIGKIADIFAHQGISTEIKGDGNMDLFLKTEMALKNAGDNTLIFTNFVDFDSKYGHRRDIVGYAQALEQFDAQLAKFIPQLKSDDIVIISADHGCDPSLPGSDHTREHIPVLMLGPKIDSRFIGRRDTFADIGQTLAEYFSLDTLLFGNSFLR